MTVTNYSDTFNQITIKFLLLNTSQNHDLPAVFGFLVWGNASTLLIVAIDQPSSFAIPCGFLHVSDFEPFLPSFCTSLTPPIHSFILGAIKTGCKKTPVLKSRFCYLHKPRACLPQSTDTLAEPANKEESGKESREGNESGTVVQLVIAK